MKKVAKVAESRSIDDVAQKLVEAQRSIEI